MIPPPVNNGVVNLITGSGRLTDDAEGSAEARTQLGGHLGPTTCRWLVAVQPATPGWPQQLQHLQDARQEGFKARKL